MRNSPSDLARNHSQDTMSPAKISGSVVASFAAKVRQSPGVDDSSPQPLMPQIRRSLAVVLAAMLTVILGLFISPLARADDSLEQMIREGIQLTEEVGVKLPPPMFLGIDGALLPPEAARTALADIAAGVGVKRFTRDSVVAPVSLDVDAIKNDDGDRIGHQVDVAFVVHLPIETLRDSDALSGFSSKDDSSAAKTADASAEQNEARSLTDAELEQAGIALAKDKEAFGLLQFPLLGKVILRGVGHARRAIWDENDPKSPLVLTWQLDSRFASDTPRVDSLDNQWRPIQRDNVGAKILGDPKPYSGLGGYIAITPLVDTPNASLIQARMVLHEPVDWFAGGNLLRSKLPLIVQDRVRDLRRQVQR